ncbi:Crp/Fnr family transcriptional regulator [Cuneatibacter sp. NSJ-177]|jgi:CRP/FNR family cyclic AMP-dependent transcriptional regulator|uniref:Crp/Fnr family transcriptional regulator n=1 Tax=Cuneatibacter sp. NSJ-177 TaxID=2931401 RepID=UPI001FD37B11|nr:Crp/Fnr family transcriptional regulator [Cuneatibacter sp. NSJ-177]MCJ7834220.1 Crp/Fnr family transcriptional regulator [Cuneatibacter sp. NSJ-177]
MADQDFLSLPAGFLSWAESLPLFRTCAPQELIYQEGQPARQFYYLKDGKVRIFVTSGEGEEKNLTVYRKNAIFGEAAFFDGSPRMTSAQALEVSHIVPITKKAVLTCFREQPDLALSMISSLSRTVRMLSDQINQIAFLPSEKRIAHFLQQEADENGLVSYTHEQIASSVGASRVTVSRTLAQWKKTGWIETEYGKIRILRPESLFGIQ